MVIKARTVVTWGLKGVRKGEYQLGWDTGEPSELMAWVPANLPGLG